jgi:hypothetical protein
MLESGMESADYLRFAAEESGNVAGKCTSALSMLQLCSTLDHHRWNWPSVAAG